MDEASKSREVERWLGTPEWEMAELLHNRLCQLGHQMDQCWGLNLPYDLNQPTLSGIQRRYIGLACGLTEAFDEDQINLILTMMDDHWEPDQFPDGPKATLCPKHGEPFIVPDCPDGFRRCTFYIPELGVSEDYGCPQPITEET